MPKTTAQKTAKRTPMTPEQRKAAATARRAAREQAQAEEARQRQAAEDEFQKNAEVHWNALWALALRMELLSRDHHQWANDRSDELVVDAAGESLSTYRSRYVRPVSEGLTLARMSLITKEQYEVILEDVVEVRDSFDRFMAELLEKRRAEEERKRLRESAKAKLSPEELRACGLA